MIQDVDWAYYRDTALVKKWNVSLTMVHKLAQHKDVRSQRRTRKDGSIFYILCKEDVNALMGGRSYD